MTSKQFVNELQEYYGMTYSKGQLMRMIDWFNKNADILDELLEAVIYGFSGQFKTLPDIAVFEDHLDEAYLIKKSKKPKQYAIAPPTEEWHLSEVQQNEMIQLLSDMMEKIKARK